MKRYVVNCSTAICGCDDEYYVEADNREEAEDTAESLAYNNFYSNVSDEELLKLGGYDPDSMSEKEKEDALNTIDESMYYDYKIREFDGTDDEWDSLPRD